MNKQPVSRRGFLKMASVGGVGAASMVPMLGAKAHSEQQNAGRVGRAVDDACEAARFRHGVASGDPWRVPGSGENKVVLWTHITPWDNADIPVYYEVATDPSFAVVEKSHIELAQQAHDWCVKVDVSLRVPGQWYYYRFWIDDPFEPGRRIVSPIGRTKTAKAETDDSPVRLAFCSCSNYVSGYFYVYQHIAQQRDLDAVVHLGDYIYETGGWLPAKASEACRPGMGDRDHLPIGDAVSLDDYRCRYAQYRSDPMLADAHRQHPWINIWDDHESVNNAYEDGVQHADQHNAEDGSWVERRDAAVQAFHEWLPIRPLNMDGSPTSDLYRPQSEHQDRRRIWRSFGFGRNAELIMTDTRLDERVRQNAANSNNKNQKIMSDDQWSWLQTTMVDSVPAREWRLLATAVPFVMTYNQDGSRHKWEDKWGGYWHYRQQLLETIKGQNDHERKVPNNVFVSGDIHWNLMFDTHEAPADATVPLAERYNPVTGENARGVEFVVGQVSRGSPDAIGRKNAATAYWQANGNHHLKGFDNEHSGWMLLDVRPGAAEGLPSEATSEWYLFDCQQLTTRPDQRDWMFPEDPHEVVKSLARTSGEAGNSIIAPPADAAKWPATSPGENAAVLAPSFIYPAIGSCPNPPMGQPGTAVHPVHAPGAQPSLITPK